jgi:hypothetical protein
MKKVTLQRKAVVKSKVPNNTWTSKEDNSLPTSSLELVWYVFKSEYPNFLFHYDKITPEHGKKVKDVIDILLPNLNPTVSAITTVLAYSVGRPASYVPAQRAAYEKAHTQVRNSKVLQLK